jgi:predicted dehydrogenase
MINRVLIIGTGSAGRKHFSIVRKILPQSEIKFFSRTNKTYLTEVSQIKSFKPNITILANPSSKRLKIIKFLTKIKTDILIEKPLASNFIEATKVYKILKKNKIKSSVGYNLRFYKPLQIIKKIILSKKLGKINFIRAEVGSYLPNWRNLNYKHTVSSSKLLGGGVLNELSHEIDYLEWIFGKFSSVFSNIQKRSKLDINVEDTGNIIFLLKNKTPISLSIDFCRRDKIRSCYISGEKGSVRLNLLSGILEIYNIKKNKWQTLKLHKKSMKYTYYLQFINFIESKYIKNKKKSEDVSADLTSALRVTKIIKYAKISSKIKKLINIR